MFLHLYLQVRPPHFDSIWPVTGNKDQVILVDSANTFVVIDVSYNMKCLSCSGLHCCHTAHVKELLLDATDIPDFLVHVNVEHDALPACGRKRIRKRDPSSSQKIPFQLSGV